MAIKPNLLLVVTRNPGTCGTCRHANHETVDFAESHIFCKWGGPARRPDQPCDQGIVACQTKFEPLETGYYYYERYDGTNCTWSYRGDYRILADDADDSVRKDMQAERPLIPPDEIERH